MGDPGAAVRELTVLLQRHHENMLASLKDWAIDCGASPVELERWSAVVSPRHVSFTQDPTGDAEEPKGTSENSNAHPPKNSVFRTCGDTRENPPEREPSKLQKSGTSGSGFSRLSWDPEGEDCRRLQEAIDVSRKPSNRSSLSAIATLARRRTPLKRFVESPIFEQFVHLAVMSNCITIGVETQYMALDPYHGIPLWILVMNTSFTSIFLVEMLFRVGAEGRQFLAPGRRGWNLFDTFIVLTSLFDTLMAGILPESKVIRIVRMWRVVRAVRAFRAPHIVRYVAPLRMLVHSTLVTMRSLFWAMVLIFVIIYVFGIVFTQAATGYRATHCLIEPRDECDQLGQFWGTLFISVLTLFQAMSGGVSWRDSLEPLASINMFYVLVFLAYISFVMFAVLNVVTGVFCSSAIETAQRDPDLIMDSLAANKRSSIERIEALFGKLDRDNSGSITYQELQEQLQADSVQAYFAALELDISDAWTLFKILDTDRTGSIDTHEFSTGLLRMKGNAKAIDFAKMELENRDLARRMNTCLRGIDSRLSSLPTGLNSPGQGLDV